jgi:hypothetical protein
VYKGKEAGSVYINFERVGEKVHPLFKALLIAGWLILFGRNFYVFRLITEPLKKFFTEDRTIGSYSFNISSVLVFFLIMSLSVITSKLVSFFASDARVGPEEMNVVQVWAVGFCSYVLLLSALDCFLQWQQQAPR